MGGSENVTVRAATPDDDAGIRMVEHDAFGEPAEAELVEMLVAGEAFLPELSLIAVAGNQVVGHVLFTRATAGAVAAVLLAPLAVAPEWQGVGIGGTLVCEGLARAAELGYGVVLVLGHPTYYPRFGFEAAEPHGVMPPYPVHPSEAWMVVELVAGTLARARGVVEVAAALMHEEMWRE